MRRLARCVFLVAAAICAVFHSTQAAQAQAVTVYAKSVDTLLDDADYLLKQIAPPEAAGQFIDMLNQFRGPEAFAGIDRKRPFGAWVIFPENQGEPPTMAGAVPIANLDQALKTIQGFGVEVNAADVPGFSHRLTLPDGNTNLFVAATDDYAFVSLVPVNAEALKATKPGDWQPRTKGPGDLAMSLRFDKVPAYLKEQMLQGMEQGIAPQRERQPGESDSSYQGRMTGMNLALNGMKALIAEGSELNFEIGVDQTKGELAIEMSTSGLAGTNMEKTLKAFGNRQSLFGGVGSGAPLSASFNLPLPADFQAVLADSIENARTQALGAAPDEKQKEIADKVISIMKPMFTADVFDMRADLVGPIKAGDGSSRYAMLAAMRVPNGKEIDKFFRETLQQLPKEEGAEIKFDVAKAADGTTIHQLTLPGGDPKAAEMFGANMAFVAVRDDAVVLTYGQEGQIALVRALDSIKKPTSSGSNNAIEIAIHAKPFAELVANLDPQRGAQAAELLQNAPAGQDSLRLTLAAPDGVLRLRMTAGMAALRVAAMVGTSAQAVIPNP